MRLTDIQCDYCSRRMSKYAAAGWIHTEAASAEADDMFPPDRWRQYQDVPRTKGDFCSKTCLINYFLPKVKEASGDQKEE